MAKWKIIAFILIYMIVNESERIETRTKLDQAVNIFNLEYKKYSNHVHYYNGKPKP